MKHTPNLHHSDLQSDGQHSKATTIRPLPLIDKYNSYYPDPDFGFDPYWDIQIYNQHHPYFYNNFNRNLTETELDSHETDHKLNTVLNKALVDPCQRKMAATSLATSEHQSGNFRTSLPKMDL